MHKVDIFFKRVNPLRKSTFLKKNKANFFRFLEIFVLLIWIN
jgi:hypothetical protein